jgi:hypothetical protein
MACSANILLRLCAPQAAAPEPEQAPTDTIWAGGIPLNLVGGEAALSSVLNLDANTNVTSLFEQFGEVKHTTFANKNAEASCFLLGL